MTDYQKYIDLLNDFGIKYTEEITNGVPSSTLVYLTERIGDMSVTSYPGFYCYFAFNTESGKFEQVGIFE